MLLLFRRLTQRNIVIIDVLRYATGAPANRIYSLAHNFYISKALIHLRSLMNYFLTDPLYVLLHSRRLLSLIF